MSGRSVHVKAVVAGAVVAAALLSGCAPDSGPGVVLPGAPGERPRTVGTADVGDVGRNAAPAAADITYVEMMIPHHEQALVMTSMAPGQASSDQVRAIADRIQKAQQPEIDMMHSWWRINVPERRPQQNPPSQHGGHGGGHGQHGGGGEHPAPAKLDHHAMPGMASVEQLAALGAARGPDFDRMFLDLMIRHHEGALTMATDMLRAGTDEQVVAMAQDVLATQTDEIAAMRTMRGH